jgi:hypothetical protein
MTHLLEGLFSLNNAIPGLQFRLRVTLPAPRAAAAFAFPAVVGTEAAITGPKEVLGDANAGETCARARNLSTICETSKGVGGSGRERGDKSSAGPRESIL